MVSGRDLTFTAKIVVIAVGIVGWLAIVSCNSTPSSQTGRPVTPSSQAGPSATPSKAYLEAQQKRAARLAEFKKHFNVTVDEFDKSTTFRHKAFSKYINGNGTTLVAEIIDNQIYVQSQYVSDQWIFHEDFIVKVGNAEVTAAGKTQHEVVSGVVETVSPNSHESQAVAELIARAGKTPVRVRLEGKFYKDYTLRPLHQQAIADTVELWHFLAQAAGTNAP